MGIPGLGHTHENPDSNSAFNFIFLWMSHFSWCCQITPGPWTSWATDQELSDPWLCWVKGLWLREAHRLTRHTFLEIQGLVPLVHIQERGDLPLISSVHREAAQSADPGTFSYSLKWMISGGPEMGFHSKCPNFTCWLFFALPRFPGKQQPWPEDTHYGWEERGLEAGPRVPRDRALAGSFGTSRSCRQWDGVKQGDACFGKLPQLSLRKGGWQISCRAESRVLWWACRGGSNRTIHGRGLQRHRSEKSLPTNT